MFAAIMIAISWGNFVALTEFGFVISRRPGTLAPGSEPFFLQFAIAATVLCVPLLVWRYLHFQRLANHGVHLIGSVTGVVPYQEPVGWSRLDYSYSFRDTAFHGHKDFRNGTDLGHYCEGDEILVVIDPAHPDRAVLPHSDGLLSVE